MNQQLMPIPAPGQIWRENDPRKERYVRIVSIRGEDVNITTVDKSSRTPVKGARVSAANLFRFGSFARGKYAFVEAPVGPMVSLAKTIDVRDFVPPSGG